MDATKVLYRWLLRNALPSVPPVHSRRERHLLRCTRSRCHRPGSCSQQAPVLGQHDRGNQGSHLQDSKAREFQRLGLQLGCNRFAVCTLSHARESPLLSYVSSRSVYRLILAGSGLTVVPFAQSFGGNSYIDFSSDRAPAPGFDGKPHRDVLIKADSADPLDGNPVIDIVDEDIATNIQLCIAASIAFVLNIPGCYF